MFGMLAIRTNILLFKNGIEKRSALCNPENENRLNAVYMMMRLLRSILFIPLMLSGCDKVAENKFLSKNVNSGTIKDLTSPVLPTQRPKKLFQPTKSIRQKIPPKLRQPVSLTLNETLPVKVALYEAANRLNINMQIDADINSKIIFRAHKKPFIEIIDAICDIANLRYTIQSGFIKIVKDTPYAKNYDVQFLNLSRDSENKISIATEVNGVKTNETENPDSKVTVKAQSDFWTELSEGLKIILEGDGSNKYSINKQSGIITVYANSKTQKDVENYISDVKAVNEGQVLIEAKIIEVALKNEYKRGINWNLITSDNTLKYNQVLGDNSVSFAFKTENMECILKAMEEFGSIRTLSNPRITAMNNQAAVLKIAQNHVYFKLNYDKTYSGNNSNREDINVSSDIKTIPIGLVMFVQPSIDIRNRTISLFLRPTITKLEDTVNDPAVDIAIRSAQIRGSTQYEPSKVPITKVREMASILKLNDGEVAVLGGFLEVISTKKKYGLPLVRDVPVLGDASGSTDINDQMVELVILVKVSIADSPIPDIADNRLQRFVDDPRGF